LVTVTKSWYGRSGAAALGFLFGAIRIAGAQAPAARLIGDVVSTETGAPLAHAMVTVLGIERQTFTSDGGVFVFSGLEPGRYRIRAVHIGYSPAELMVEIPAGGAPPPRVKLALTHLSIQLATVKVVATSICRTPGRPNPDVEPDFAAIVGQLRMNAEQFQLLSDSFPYKYKVEEEFFGMRGDSTRTDESVETENFRSDTHGWEYRVGDMIGKDRRGTTVHLPTLRDFASYEFLNNHCFSYGGTVTTRDGVFIKIGFQADVQLRAPDVTGSVLLDAKTYQIRRAEFRLTKVPANMPEVTAIDVTTIFGEVSPSIDIITAVHGLTSIHHRGWGAIVARGEDERMFGIEWIGADPAHPIQP
jgi:hypothetical protein